MLKQLKTLQFMWRKRDTVAVKAQANRPLPSTAALAAVLALSALWLGGCGLDENPFSGSRADSPPETTGAPPPGGSAPPPANDHSPPPSPGTASVTLSWQAPTERADGSPLTDLAGFRIYYGTQRDDLETVIDLNNPGLSRYVVENLTAGTWYFSMTAYDRAGLQSSPSPTVEARLN